MSENESINQSIESGTTPAIELHRELNQNNVDAVQSDLSQAYEEWFLREGVPGSGEKPEWFNNKTFKTVEEQAKAQAELRKILGSVPGEYKMDLGDEYKDVNISDDDPLLVQFNKYAKENKISSKAYNNMIKTWIDYQKSEQIKLQEQAAIEQKKELDAIGPDALQKLDELHAWYSQNFGDEDIDAFKNSIQTKADFDRMIKIREKMGYAKSPDANSSNNIKKPFELRAMMNDKKYAMDAQYTKMVDDEYRKYYGK